MIDEHKPDRYDLNNMTVVQLREHARKHTDQPGLLIAGMKKHELISAILGEGVPGNGNGNGNTPPGQVDLADVLAQAISGKIKAGLDEDRVREIIAETGIDEDRVKELVLKYTVDGATISAMIHRKLDEMELVKTIEIKAIDGTIKAVGKQHFLFEKILKLANRRRNVLLVGPAGSGKTYLCEQVAQALSLNYYCISVGVQTAMSHLFGYMDANGRYVSTQFRQAYEHGGLFLLDEFDAGNGNVLVAINAATSNGQAAFPDAMVKRHPDFICLAAGNTYGLGANRQYVGRNPIDGATRNRFAMIDFPYDEKLEFELAPNKDWCRTVQKIRKVADELGEKVIVSPRATFNGGEDLASGFTQAELKEIYIYQGVNREVKNRIEARC
jgi:GTPase SAR1 family protein